MSHDHDCHVPGCATQPTRANRTFCRRHWYALPDDIKERIRWAMQEDEDGEAEMELASALEAALDSLT